MLAPERLSSLQNGKRARPAGTAQIVGPADTQIADRYLSLAGLAPELRPDFKKL